MFHRGERAHQPASQPASHPTDQPTTVSSTLMPFNLNIHYRTHIYTHNAVIEKSMAGAADLAQRATILFFFHSVCIKSFSPPADSQAFESRERICRQNGSSRTLTLWL
jgi:hypothetical protein